MVAEAKKRDTLFLVALKSGDKMNKKGKLYEVLKKGVTILTTIPGKYAGWRRGKIFGRLDCKSGMRMKKENRVFFHTWDDAIEQGYRPCKKCKPTR